MLVIVFRCRPAASARSRTVQFRAARAIRSCALVTGMNLCYCHMCCCHKHNSMIMESRVMPEFATTLRTHKKLPTPDRRHFIGGSDPRIVIGNEQVALIRMWREKRGEVEPEDLSGNLIVQLGVVTEPLN